MRAFLAGLPSPVKKIAGSFAAVVLGLNLFTIGKSFTALNFGDHTFPEAPAAVNHSSNGGSHSSAKPSSSPASQPQQQAEAAINAQTDLLDEHRDHVEQMMAEHEQRVADMQSNFDATSSSFAELNANTSNATSNDLLAKAQSNLDAM